jgi:hypothetical protein
MGASGRAYKGHPLTLIPPFSVGQFSRPKRFKKLQIGQPTDAARPSSACVQVLASELDVWHFAWSVASNPGTVACACSLMSNS